MTLKEFIESRKFLTLKNYDNEKVVGYSYDTENFPIDPKWDTDLTPEGHSVYCEEHHWITKIDKKGLKGIDGTQYLLRILNTDYLYTDLSKLEKMLYNFLQTGLVDEEEEEI